MSASNWTQCPRCEQRRQVSLEAERIEISQVYGKVPVEEFDLRRKAYEERLRERPEPTFREDYEIYGADTGELHIRYGGGCVICGLTHEFSDDQTLNIDGDNRG
jgi:hypothetical protein